jgi:ATP-dependent Clp protease protease subunit
MSRNIPEHSEQFHSNGLYLPTRTIWIDGDESDENMCLTAKSARRDIKNIHILEALNSSPITIYLNCGGGDTLAGMAIYDAIAQCKSHVTMIVRGKAASMGSIILQAADERVMSINSCMLIHMGEVEYKGNGTEVDSERKLDKYMDNVHIDIYLARIKQKKPKFTKERLQSLLTHGTFLTAREAVDIGLADKVLGEP